MRRFEIPSVGILQLCLFVGMHSILLYSLHGLISRFRTNIFAHLETMKASWKIQLCSCEIMQTSSKQGSYGGLLFGSLRFTKRRGSVPSTLVELWERQNAMNIAPRGCTMPWEQTAKHLPLYLCIFVDESNKIRIYNLNKQLLFCSWLGSKPCQDICELLYKLGGHDVILRRSGWLSHGRMW